MRVGGCAWLLQNTPLVTTAPGGGVGCLLDLLGASPSLDNSTVVFVSWRGVGLAWSSISEGGLQVALAALGGSNIVYIATKLNSSITD